MGEHYYYVRFDGRGTGLSDRGISDFSLDARVRDVEAVMDALQVNHGGLFGDSVGGATAIAYTVKHPDRVSRLVLYGSYMRWPQSAEEVQRWKAMITLARSDWGTDTPAYRQMWAALFMPDATPSDVSGLAENERKSMTPEDAAAFLTASLATDATTLAPKVAVPTLIMHCRGDLVVPFEQGRQLAAVIPGAKLVTFESRNHIFVSSESIGMQFFGAFIEFLNQDPHHGTRGAWLQARQDAFTPNTPVPRKDWTRGSIGKHYRFDLNGVRVSQSDWPVPWIRFRYRQAAASFSNPPGLGR